MFSSSSSLSDSESENTAALTAFASSISFVLFTSAVMVADLMKSFCSLVKELTENCVSKTFLTVFTVERVQPGSRAYKAATN